MSFKISILCVSDHDCLIALLADITKFMLLIKPKSLGHFYMEDRVNTGLHKRIYD